MILDFLIMDGKWKNLTESDPRATKDQTASLTIKDTAISHGETSFTHICRI